MTKTIDNVPTPAVLIDLPTVRRNLRRAADYAARHKLALRPHTKTHKSKLMARLQIESGAIGLAVAKAGEAEALASVDGNILVAYPTLDPIRIEKLVHLARTGKTIRVAVDSAFAADQLGYAGHAAGIPFGLLVDLDVGHHRTGVQGAAEALKLAQHIDRTPGARLDGVMIYPGHMHDSPAKQSTTLGPIRAILAEALDAMHRSGLATPIVSGGSTPTLYQSHLIPELTEIRPGTYIYNDRTELVGGYCAQDDCAAVVVATVISTAVPGKFVLDAGSKALTRDPSWAAPDGFGLIVEYPQAKVTRLTEEHGEVDASGCDRLPKLGQRVRVIPNHICPCINLYDSVWLRDGANELTRCPIEARGKTN